MAMILRTSLQRIGIGAGIMTAGAYILFFVLMKYAHLIHLLELRAVNFFLLIGGVILALNRFKSIHHNHLTYFEGFGLGMLTAIIASIIFSVFVGLYLSMNPEFMAYIKANAVMGDYLNPSACALAIAIEGLVSGLVVSFGSMQYYKRYEIGHLD